MPVLKTLVSKPIWRLVILSAGLLVLLDSLAAHSVSYSPRQGSKMVIEVGETTGRIRVRNGSGEGDPNNCTTKVEATFTSTDGARVTITGRKTYRGAGGSSTTLTVTPNKGGTGRMRVKWEVTSAGSNCGGTAPPTTFSVEIVDADNPLMSDAAIDNNYSDGDPVSLASGELHDPRDLTPDLSLGGPLPLGFARYYGAYLRASGFEGNLGNNWTHNFDFSVSVEAGVASVNLFGGNTISFMRDGADWTLSSTEKLDHQLIDVAAGGYKFLDLDTERIYTFDAQGRLTSIEDRNGNTLTVAQGGNSPDMVSDGLGRSIELTYTAGKLTQIEDQSGRTVQYRYTGDNLTAVTNPRGNTTTYAYTTKGDVEGLLRSTTLPDGSQPANQVFDDQARVTTQTDGEGGTTQFAYELAPNETGSSVTDANGAVRRYVHPEGQNLSRATDEAGASDATTYDGNNRVISYTTPGGEVGRLTYHEPSGFPATVTDLAGETLRMDYEEQEQDGFRFYRVTRVTYPDGTAEQFEWDANGNLITFIDRAGETWTMTYNPRGQNTAITNPLGGTATISYNADGTPSEVVTFGGASREFTYDEVSRPSAIEFADGSQRTAMFNAAGGLEQAVDQLGRTFRIQYDENGRVEVGTDASGDTRMQTYDGNSRVTDEIDRSGRRTTTTYDAVGNVASISTDAGNQIRFDYEDRNLVSDVSDEVGPLASYTYDAEGRIATATDPLGNTGELDRDEVGRVTQFTLPGGQVYQFTYDALGRLTSLTTPVGRVRVNTHDPRGNIASTDVASVTASYDFNAFGGITEIIDPNGNASQRTFDGGGRRTSSTDSLGRITRYSYDEVGRLTEVETPLGPIRRTFDAVGNLTQRTFADGSSLDYAYDDDDRFISGTGVAFVRDPSGRIVNSNGVEIEYGPAGRIETIRYADGKEVRYEYDARGRVISVTDWLGGETRLIYDAADHLIEIQRPNGVTTEITYDPNEWVLSVQHTGQNVSLEVALERDESGQITSQSIESPLDLHPAGGVLSFTYDAANQIADAEYDDRGRITRDRIRQYTWDGDGRLTAYAGADGMAGFTYDAFGNRISRSNGAGAESYVLNYAHPLAAVAVVRSDGAVKRYYIYLPNGILLHSIEADNSRRFYHFDHLGSTQMLTDDAGAMTDAYRVTPFGEQVRSQGSSDQPFVYHGALGVEWERGTSLYYMRQRYYDGAWGRFLTPDPISQLDPLRMNTYLFAVNNPLSFNDPTGLSPLPQFFSSVNPKWDEFSPGGAPPNFPDCDGNLPLGSNPVLTGSLLDRIRSGQTGRSIPGNSGCQGGGCNEDTAGNDFIARGYVTIDNNSDCSLVFPNDTGFFDGEPGVGADVNELWGDWLLIQQANNFAQGDTLVHVEASDTLGGPANPVGSSPNPTGYTFYGRYFTPLGAGDNREPLATTWTTRYFTSTPQHSIGGAGYSTRFTTRRPFDGGTSLTVWRDSQCAAGQCN